MTLSTYGLKLTTLINTRKVVKHERSYVYDTGVWVGLFTVYRRPTHNLSTGPVACSISQLIYLYSIGNNNVIAQSYDASPCGLGTDLQFDRTTSLTDSMHI